MTNLFSVSGDTRAHLTPTRLPRKDATDALTTSVVSFFDQAAEWIAEQPGRGETVANDGRPERDATPPRHAVIAEAGIGKTEIVLKSAADPFWQSRRVLYLVPSIDLADDLAKRARAMGIANAHVIRGRSQPDPERPGQTMCAKAEIAERISSLGYNVTETLCAGKDPEGKEVECEFRASCPYFQQLQARKTGPGLLIGAHAYLSIAMEMLNEKRIDLIIIDESFWQSMVRQAVVPIERFTVYRMPGAGARQYRPKKGETIATAELRFMEDAEEFEAIQRKAVAAIRAAQDDKRPLLLADFRAAHLSPGDCRFAAGVEYTRLGKPELHPGMTFAAQDEASKRASNREAFAMARIWKCLGAELETDRQGEPMSVRIENGRFNKRSQALENVLCADFTVDARFQAVPMLAIDADADPVIIDRFYPGVGSTIIASEWNGIRVRQVTDRSGSKLAFSNPENQARVRGIAEDIAAQLSHLIDRPEKRPLVVCQKAVEEAWKEQGHALDYDGETPDPCAPFRVAHFGNTRGKDQWRETVAAIIVGRIEPSPQQLERMARAVFFRSPEALIELEANDTGRIQLPRRNVVTRARDGRTATVAVSFHPDDRADRILRQIREAEINQAIARVRPVHRANDAPCEVLVLTNIPLRIEPDEFTTWNRVVPDRWRTMEMAGFVPDLATDVADAYPSLFASAAAVRQAASRRERKCDEFYEGDFYRGCHTYEGTVRVEFRREGNRRRRQGAMMLRPGDTSETVAERVRAALPDAYGVILLGALPDPVEAATAALDAAIELDAYIDEAEAAGDVIWWRVRPETRRAASRWNGTRPPEVVARRPDPDRAPFAFR